MGEGSAIDRNKSGAWDEKPGKEKQRDRVLSEHEIRAFWEWTESEAFAVASNNLGDTTKYIFQLVLLTGQRPGEVCQIKQASSLNSIAMPARVWMIIRSIERTQAALLGAFIWCRCPMLLWRSSIASMKL